MQQRRVVPTNAALQVAKVLLYASVKQVQQLTMSRTS
jgi:hypothetical protein